MVSPSGQAAFDNTNNFDGTFVFDELGLKVGQVQLILVNY